MKAFVNKKGEVVGTYHSYAGKEVENLAHLETADSEIDVPKEMEKDLLFGKLRHDFLAVKGGKLAEISESEKVKVKERAEKLKKDQTYDQVSRS